MPISNNLSVIHIVPSVTALVVRLLTLVTIGLAAGCQKSEVWIGVPTELAEVPSQEICLGKRYLSIDQTRYLIGTAQCITKEISIADEDESPEDYNECDDVISRADDGTIDHESRSSMINFIVKPWTPEDDRSSDVQDYCTRPSGLHMGCENTTLPDLPLTVRSDKSTAMYYNFDNNNVYNQFTDSDISYLDGASYRDVKQSFCAHRVNKNEFVQSTSLSGKKIRVSQMAISRAIGPWYSGVAACKDLARHNFAGSSGWQMPGYGGVTGSVDYRTQDNSLVPLNTDLSKDYFGFWYTFPYSIPFSPLLSQEQEVTSQEITGMSISSPTSAGKISVSQYLGINGNGHNFTTVSPSFGGFAGTDGSMASSFFSATSVHSPTYDDNPVYSYWKVRGLSTDSQNLINDHDGLNSSKSWQDWHVVLCISP